MQKELFSKNESEKVEQVLSNPNKTTERTLSLDTETTGLSLAKDRVIVAAFSTGQETVSFNFPQQFSQAKQLLERGFETLVGFNLKFDLKFLIKEGLRFENYNPFDSMVAYWLLSESGRNKGLKPLVREILGVNPLAMDRANISQLALFDSVEAYCRSDAYYSYLIYLYYKNKLEKTPRLKTLFYEVEMPFLKVLTAMESRGIMIDVELLRQMSKDIERNILPKQMYKCYELAGTHFNINSNKQLSQLLFPKTHKQQSVGKAVLEELDNPLAKAVLEYRKTFKLLSSFILPFLRSGQEVIYCDFLQTGTVTSRLASRNPNLQNIPANELRKIFIPRPGYRMLVADYSSLELRVLAHLIKCITKKPSVLVQAIEAGEDAHTVMASQFLNKTKISKEERRYAKTITFGVIYGMRPHGLAKRLNIEYDEAVNLYHRYMRTFPEIKQIQDYFIEEGTYNKYVENIFGYRRRFRENDSVETEATNAVIQSTAAYIMKLAQIKLYEEHPDIYQLIQVHDEVVAETKDPEGLKKLKETMETATSLKVPLVANAAEVNNWYEGK